MWPISDRLSDVGPRITYIKGARRFPRQYPIKKAALVVVYKQPATRQSDSSFPKPNCSGNPYLFRVASYAIVDPCERNNKAWGSHTGDIQAY